MLSLSATKIRGLLEDEVGRRVEMAIVDRDYAVPNRTWLLTTFNRYYRRKVFGFWHRIWKPTFDCDNFAGLYHHLAKLCHSQSKNKGVESLAVGELHYHDEKLGPHAINIVFTETGVYYVEPQTGKAKTLTRKEIESTIRCII